MHMVTHVILLACKDRHYFLYCKILGHKKPLLVEWFLKWSRDLRRRRPELSRALIANKLTAKPQVGVDYRGKNTVKSVQNEKYSAKSADFLRFLLYLCHVIDDFACLDLQH